MRLAVDLEDTKLILLTNVAVQHAGFLIKHAAIGELNAYYYSLSDYVRHNVSPLSRVISLLPSLRLRGLSRCRLRPYTYF